MFDGLVGATQGLMEGVIRGDTAKSVLGGRPSEQYSDLALVHTRNSMRIINNSEIA